MGIQEQHC
jgi:hypothetical protein